MALVRVVAGKASRPVTTPDHCRKDYTIYDNKARITRGAASGTIVEDHRRSAGGRDDSMRRAARISEY